MATVREQRKAFLRSIGMDEKSFNKSIKAMVERESRLNRTRSLGKSKARRATKNWKRRNDKKAKA
jgi:hypothetical protein